MIAKVQLIEQHYTLQQAAGLLSCDESTLRRAIRLGRDTSGREGLYPVAHVGSHPRIPASSLASWSGARSFFAEIPVSQEVDHD